MHQTRSNVKTHVNATTIHALNLLRNRKIVLFKPFGEAKFFQVLIYSKSFFSLTGKLCVTAAYFFVLLGLFLNFLQLVCVCVCGCMWVYVCVCMCVEGSGLGGKIPINFGKGGYLPHPFQQGAKPTYHMLRQCISSSLPVPPTSPLHWLSLPLTEHFVSLPQTTLM